MRPDVATIIEKWFAEHDHDGDFSRPARAVPYLVVGPASEMEPVVYATKPMLVSVAMRAATNAVGWSLLGRCGLPTMADWNWLDPFIGSRKLLFLGDMDPPDLMIFAWLRDRLRPKTIQFLGMNDQFLEASGVSSPESSAMPLSESELQSLAILPEIVPDFNELVGRDSAGMFESGYKIEVEAVMAASHPPGISLHAALERVVRS